MFQKVIKIFPTFLSSYIHLQGFTFKMKTIDQAIGEQIRVKREAAVITEAAFARALKMSLGRLALCEAGQARFSVVDLQRVCDALAIRPAMIYAAVGAECLRPPSS